MNDLSSYEGKEKRYKEKVTEAEIVVHGTVEKPYFEIKYKEVGKDNYTIGYSSYYIDNVFKWLEECFEVVQDEMV